MKKHLLKSWGRCEVSEETSLTSQPTLLIATSIKVVIPGRAAVIHTTSPFKKKPRAQPNFYHHIGARHAVPLLTPLNPHQSYAQSPFPTAGRPGSGEKGSCLKKRKLLHNKHNLHYNPYQGGCVAVPVVLLCLVMIWLKMKFYIDLMS